MNIIPIGGNRKRMFPNEVMTRQKNLSSNISQKNDSYSNNPINSKECNAQWHLAIAEKSSQRRFFSSSENKAQINVLALTLS